VLLSVFSSAYSIGLSVYIDMLLHFFGLCTVRKIHDEFEIFGVANMKQSKCLVGKKQRKIENVKINKGYHRKFGQTFALGKSFLIGCWFRGMMRGGGLNLYLGAS